MKHIIERHRDYRENQEKTAKGKSKFPVKNWNDMTEEEKKVRFKGLLDDCRNPVLVTPDLT